MVKIGPAFPTHGGLFIEFPTVDVACKVCAALQESQVKVTLLPSIYVSLGRGRWAFIGTSPTLYCSQTSWTRNRRFCWCSLMREAVVTRGGACCQGSDVILTHIRCSILRKVDHCQGGLQLHSIYFKGSCFVIAYHKATNYLEQSFNFLQSM